MRMTAQRCHWWTCCALALAALAPGLHGCDGALPSNGLPISFDGHWAIGPAGADLPDECVIIYEDEIVQWTGTCMMPTEQIVSAEKSVANGNRRMWTVTVLIPSKATSLEYVYDVEIQADGTLKGTRTGTVKTGTQPGLQSTHDIVMTRY